MTGAVVIIGAVLMAAGLTPLLRVRHPTLSRRAGARLRHLGLGLIGAAFALDPTLSDAAPESPPTVASPPTEAPRSSPQPPAPPPAP
jgi:hypothetical protein